MDIEEFFGELLAPVDDFAVGEFEEVDVGGVEGLGHGVVVVVFALGAHAGVFVESVVLAEPLEGGLDAGVVLGEAGVDEAEEASVADAAVGAEGDTPVGGFDFLTTGFDGVVDEAAGVFGIVADPRGFVGFGAVLAALDEVDGGGEVEFGLVFGGVTFVGEEGFGVVEGFHDEVGVGEVGVVAFVVAVADAAVEGVVVFAGFIEVHLAGDEEAAGFEHDFFILEFGVEEEGHEGEGGVVVGAGFDVDAAVGLGVFEQEGDAFGGLCGGG